jgi:transposase-like protein DUF772
LIGFFEGLDAERAIAWRAADSFALREFPGLVRRPEAPPGHSTISRTRDIPLASAQTIAAWKARMRLTALPGCAAVIVDRSHALATEQD